MNEIKSTKKGAVIYCRVSTKEQVEEGNSLATQERICKEYAFSHDYEVIETYREQGESAKTADRTELQRLLTFCAIKRNGIKVVIIYKLDRLSRNTDDYSQLRLMLKRYGVEIKSTSEHFENTPVGRFMENTLANISQFDNDIRAERCSGGMKEAIREGRYVWKAPIGYDNVRVCGKATIAQNAALSPLVRRAFELVASNTCSVEEAYRIMTKEGLTRNGKPLVGSYFREMLVNELYAGQITKFGERHKGLFTSIVSDELFAQVQRVLKYKGKLHAPHISDNPDFPLRRFIVNENNKKLTGSWSKGRTKKYPYYRFERSGGYNYNRDEFEKAFRGYMDTYCLNDEYFQKLTMFIKDELVAREEIEKRDYENRQKHIQELTARQSILINKNMDGFISDAILKQQLDAIEIELLKAHSALYTATDSNIDMQEAVAYLEPYFKAPSVVWLNAAPQTKLALLRFQFPEGCRFINGSFETVQIRKFFKVKSELSRSHFGRVDSSLEISNKPLFPNTISNQGHTNTELAKNKLEFNEDFWRDFRHDIATVYRILKGDKAKPP